MLYAVIKAILDLLFPLKWAGVLIPVLPARLIQALHAPTPYLIGIEKRYDRAELPEEDFVLVDLDEDVIESTAQPTPIPRQQRRKLVSLLQLAAPLHYRHGVKPGPPAYCVETYPNDAFTAELPSIFSPSTPSTNLAKLVNLNSVSFGGNAQQTQPGPPLFNAFFTSKTGKSQGNDRPRTSSTSKMSGSPQGSPTSGSFPQLPVTPVSRNDSGFALQSSLREKRSGVFDEKTRRSSSFGTQEARRRPSVPFLGHSSNLSMTNLNSDVTQNPGYAPSAYAQSTLAASTIMPQVLMQPVRNTDTTSWVEGHCFQWRGNDDRSTCSICEEKADQGMYRCSGCGATAHGGCAGLTTLPCPVAFRQEQVRAAFVRCFASLFYTYRKHLGPATAQQKKNGMIYALNVTAFLRSLPPEHADYMATLQQTQGMSKMDTFMGPGP